MRRIAWVLGCTLMGLCCATAVYAQDQTDILTGRVVNDDGRPVLGAIVEVYSLDMEIIRRTETDSEGKYVLLFPDGGGRYEMRVSFLGYEDRVLSVMRQADEEVLITQVTLFADPLSIQGLDVSVRNSGPPGRGDAGSQGIVLSQALINRLPLPDFDPALIAALAPGVVLTEADTANGIAGFSVAGQRDALNQVTLDGASITSVLTGQRGGTSPIGLPEEGVRTTRVMTNTYDVSRGQFSGGLVAMTTARGVNRFGGSMSYNVRDPALQGGTSGLQNSFSQNRVSGGVGGPLIRNKLFFNVSFTGQRRTDALFSLSPGADNPLAAVRLGVNADSIARFMGILGDGYGISSEGQTGPFDRTGDAASLLARVDFNGWERHTLMIRADASAYDQDNARINSLELIENGGRIQSQTAGGLISFNSRLGGTWINQGRISLNQSNNDQDPYVFLPEGRIRLNSELSGQGIGDPAVAGRGRRGGRGISTMAFGGDRNLPSGSFERTLEFTDELSVLLGFKHRLKFGVLANRVSFEQDATQDLFGTFQFNSLAALEALQPSLYTRSLTPQTSTGSATAWATYLGDTWRPSDPLQITMGLRLEGNDYGSAPAFNPLVEDRFGRSTDVFPTEVRVSPRVGFSYRLSEQNRPLKLLRGGIGEFRGRAPLSLFAAAQEQTGLVGSEIQLVCLGAAVPTPDWDLYRNDPSTIPTTCADGQVTGPQATRQPNVTTFDPGFTSPRSVRASLGYQTALWTRFSASFDAMYARGVSLYGVRDLNLDVASATTLAAEGGRSFFGDPSTIVPASGTVSIASSRLDPEFRHVTDLVSDLSSSTIQLTASFGLVLGRGTILQTNYTYSRSRDESSFSCCSAVQGFQSATTGGNPNISEWATSSFERRHSMTALAAFPVGDWLDLSLIGRVSSGSPFTPMVGSDINGDGVRNDRAFIFDPSAAPGGTQAASMTRLLDVLAGGVRDCLESQFGSVAERNSCRGDWTTSLDMSATLRPSLRFAGIDDRLTVSLDVSNVPAGLDLLFHGNDDLHGWGQASRPNSTLLVATGFDPQAGAFRYDVNEQFGQSTQGRVGRGSPFQVQITARLAIGSNIGGLFGGGGRGGGARGGRGRGGALGGGGRGGIGGGRGGFGAGGVGGIRGAGRGGAGGRTGRGGGGALGAGGSDITTRVLANPVPIVLELADTLALTPDQRGAIQGIADRLDQRLTPTVEKIRAVLAEAQSDQEEGAAEAGALIRELLPEIQEGRDAIGAAMEEVEEVLTEEQWRTLPAALRNPIRRGGGRRGGG